MRIYLTGFGVGAGVWAASLFVPPPTQFVLWGISLTIDVLTPWAVWELCPRRLRSTRRTFPSGRQRLRS